MIWLARTVPVRGRDRQRDRGVVRERHTGPVERRRARRAPRREAAREEPVRCRTPAALARARRRSVGSPRCTRGARSRRLEPREERLVGDRPGDPRRGGGQGAAQGLPVLERGERQPVGVPVAAEERRPPGRRRRGRQKRRGLRVAPLGAARGSRGAPRRAPRRRPPRAPSRGARSDRPPAPRPGARRASRRRRRAARARGARGAARSGSRRRGSRPRSRARRSGSLRLVPEPELEELDGVRVGHAELRRELTRDVALAARAMPRSSSERSATSAPAARRSAAAPPRGPALRIPRRDAQAPHAAARCGAPQPRCVEHCELALDARVRRAIHRPREGGVAVAGRHVGEGVRDHFAEGHRQSLSGASPGCSPARVRRCRGSRPSSSSSHSPHAPRPRPSGSTRGGSAAWPFSAPLRRRARS